MKFFNKCKTNVLKVILNLCLNMHLRLQKNPLIIQSLQVEEMSHENEYYKRISKRRNPFKMSLRLLIWSPEAYTKTK